jgi:hypothetical protein
MWALEGPSIHWASRSSGAGYMPVTKFNAQHMVGINTEYKTASRYKIIRRCHIVSLERQETQLEWERRKKTLKKKPTRINPRHHISTGQWKIESL